MYGVYDLKNYEMCVGMFDTPQEVANFFNTSKDPSVEPLSTSRISPLKEEFINDKITESRHLCRYFSAL